MTDEMRELIEKAESGDTDSQFALGSAYAFGKDGFAKDVQQAIYWLNKLDGKYVGALHTLIGIYKGVLGDEFKNPDEIIKCFDKLVKMHGDKDPIDSRVIVAMVDFGTILAADPDNSHISEETGGIPELVAYYDPQKAFELIEQGVRLAEMEMENPLKYVHYSDIHGAYHSEIRKAYKGELREKGQFKGWEAPAKKVVYAQRAIASLEKGNTSYRPETVAQLIPHHKTQVKSGRKELRLGIKALVLVRGSEEFYEETLSIINKLRQSDFSVDREAADLIEKYLREAERETIKLGEAQKLKEEQDKQAEKRLRSSKRRSTILLFLQLALFALFLYERFVSINYFYVSYVFSLIPSWTYAMRSLIRANQLPMIINIAIMCIPMAVFCLTVGIISLKRSSAIGGNLIIVGMILAQIVALIMFNNDWLNLGTVFFDGEWFLVSRYLSVEIVPVILISVVSAIPGLVVNNRRN
ncbi:MAG: hypothetical protein FWC96_08865 [Oscillospiraceae bacterium]|nr:hypothetical protein [Oscillospiraceae bacterium]